MDWELTIKVSFTVSGLIKFLVPIESEPILRKPSRTVRWNREDGVPRESHGHIWLSNTVHNFALRPVEVGESVYGTRNQVWQIGVNPPWWNHNTLFITAEQPSLLSIIRQTKIDKSNKYIPIQTCSLMSSISRPKGVFVWSESQIPEGQNCIGLVRGDNGLSLAFLVPSFTGDNVDRGVSSYAFLA